MSDTARTNAKRRASYARADRLKRERVIPVERGTDAAQNPSKENAPDRQPTKAGQSAERKDAAADHVLAYKKAVEAVRDEARKQSQKRDDTGRSVSKRETAKAEQRQAERQKADQIRSADAAKAAERRAGQNRKETEQRRVDRLRAATKREFNRKAEDRVAAQKKLDAQRQDAAKRDIQKREDGRREATRQHAEALVKEREKRHQADQVHEHRRQTDRMRTQHSIEMRSHTDNASHAISVHAQKIKNIDLAEKREFAAFAARNRTISGRLTSLVRGPAHAAREEKAITDRHEAQRMQAHKNHEILKDRQFAAAQASRIRQAHERKAIFDQHRAERRELVAAHARDRPRQVEQHRQALEATRLRQTREKTLSHDFDRGRTLELKR